MKKKLIIPALVLLLAAQACKRDNPGENQGGVNDNITNIEEMKVPASFDYATTREVTLDVKLNDAVGAPYRGVKVDVYDIAVEHGAKPRLLATGVTTKYGELVVPMALPTYLKTVVIFPHSLGIPNNVTVPVAGNMVAFHFANGKILSKTEMPVMGGDGLGQGGMTRKAGIADKFSKKLGTWNSNGKPAYLEPFDDTISASFSAKITNALPESKAVPTYKPEYLANGFEPKLTITQASDVWITFVHEGASLKNSLFYYVYNKNNPPATVNDIDSLYIILPNCSFNGSGGELAAGNKVKIGTFGPDTVVSFAMAANGFNVLSNVTPGLNIWYTQKSFNNEASFYQQHAIMLRDDSTKRYLIGFEDVKRDNGASDQDFNDLVFYATSNPLTAIDPTGIPPLTETADCDADGVTDFYDDYPCDPTKAYDRYFPSADDYGTLAFEDLWPSTGDYDMNDLVLRWRFHAVVNPSNNVIELNCKAYVQAKGGTFPAGFGVEFPFNASLVNQVTGYDITRSRVTLNSKGLEAGHTKAVMILFDEATDQLSQPGGSFYNTRNFSPVATPDTINMKMTFSGTVSFTNLGIYPFNPFLFTTSRDVEVHLPNKNNTALANAALFGTSNDRTVPPTTYYKTQNGLPWALHMPVGFDYPSEKTSIIAAHLKFTAWVQSNGTNFADWYENKAGYRDNANLFTR